MTGAVEQRIKQHLCVEVIKTASSPTSTDDSAYEQYGRNQKCGLLGQGIANDSHNLLEDHLKSWKDTSVEMSVVELSSAGSIV